MFPVYSRQHSYVDHTFFLLLLLSEMPFFNWVGLSWHLYKEDFQEANKQWGKGQHHTLLGMALILLITGSYPNGYSYSTLAPNNLIQCWITLINIHTPPSGVSWWWEIGLFLNWYSSPTLGCGLFLVSKIRVLRKAGGSFFRLHPLICFSF